MRTANGWAACAAIAAIAAAFVTGAGQAAPIVEENLCDFRPSKFASWLPKRDVPVKTLYGARLDLDARRKSAHLWLCGYFFPAYVVGEKVRVSFRYRGNAPKFSAVVDLRYPNEKPLSGQVKTPYSTYRLEPKTDWQDFSVDIDWPGLDWWGTHLVRVAAEGDGKPAFVELAGITIRELPPARLSGRALTVGGARATEVAVLTTDDGFRHAEELRAARMFRYMLYMNGGDYLPVRTAKTMAEIGPNAVLVGAAAEQAGLFTEADLATAHKRLSGACAWRAKGTRLGITGELPVGMTYGVFCCWRALGVEYLGNMKWRNAMAARAEREPYRLADGAGESRVPAIAFRGDNCRGDTGLMPELRGRCFTDRVQCTYSEGCRVKDLLPDHNMPGALVTLEEFARTRPDFFAQRQDGSRMTNEVPWRVQYCMSNEDLKRLTAARILEMMRLHPESRIFPVSPGDGGGNYCKCAKCRTRPVSDIWMDFVNHIAETTCHEFPDNLIEVTIYADNREPPKSVRMHPKLTGDYNVYTTTWPSCMVIDDPVNKHAWEEVESWWKIHPRLRLDYFPSECGENFNMWASFDSDNLIVSRFARHGCLGTRYFGFAIARGGTMPQTPGFCDLRLYTTTRVEEDPDYDAVKGAHGFIRDFYGAAAPEMAAYFELFRGEAKRRRWIQNCEQHLKGFVTKEFAAKCLPLLDAAEEKLKDDPVNLPAVLHEKQNFLWTYLDGVNRGCGNVSKADFPAWAARVADFIRICRATDIDYLTYMTFPKWFREIAFLEVTLPANGRWLDSPEILAVEADPVKGLGGEFPTMQKAAPGGYEIPASGFAGGEFWAKSSWLRKGTADERTLRRPSSGFGLVTTRLRLKAKPTKDVTMQVLAIDNDHPPVAEMALVVNEKTVYSGKVPWRKDRWEEKPFVIPADLLVAGDNEIQFRNTTGDGDEKDGECGEMFRAQHNYYWGWYSIEKLRFEVDEKK